MLAVIRLRGSVNVRKEINDTLKMLRLHHVNHAALINNSPSYLGMLQKAKDYITWGEIDADTLNLLLSKRGRLIGDKKLSDQYIKEKLKFKTIEEFAKAVYEKQAKLNDLPDLKPVFRLHPPKGGFYRTVKRALHSNGELGYRGGKINELLKKMI
ncbi:MAG: 50S ribosomal protein L30 [Candidatus Jordarchaeum sp.]|uniref:50S ribosomal protein L30 n=1 Tax=Candidatus Jordarchaeum sp. TaxID=2823881 RepID=UPI00404B2D37